MDDVPVVATQTVVRKKSDSRESGASVQGEAQESIIRLFFRVFPFAAVTLVQAFFFGRLMGSYTTFPVFTIHSYIVLTALLVLLVIMQMVMRSMIFSPLFGVALIAGVCNEYFGDFWNPVYSNLRGFLEIVGSAWSNRDIPYPVLISGIISGIFLAVMIVQFMFAVFIKYLFEVVFGSDWGDGRVKAFCWAILFLLVTHLGLSLYLKKVGNPERVVWYYSERYAPIQEYLVRVPSGAIVSEDMIWNVKQDNITTIDIKTGTQTAKRDFVSQVMMPFWSTGEFPVVADSKRILAFDRLLMGEVWQTAFPERLPHLADSEPREDEQKVVPIALRSDLSPDIVLVMFDYGYWAGYDRKQGKQLWMERIDSPARVNRVMIEELVYGPYVLADGKRAFFSCNNSVIKAVNLETGETLWDYKDREFSFAGSGQRARISLSPDGLLATLPSGALVALNPDSGRVAHDLRNSEWRPSSPGYWIDQAATFVSSDGRLWKVRMDNGETIFRQPLMAGRVALMPFILDLRLGFAGWGENLVSLQSEGNRIVNAISFRNRTFAANPVLVDSMIYVGTQDGWIICLHRYSYDEKWRVHLGGELIAESLTTHEEGVLVRTRSGSVAMLKPGF